MTTITGECHPACRLLPELDADQFAELVKDIEAHGQRHPIIVDEAGVILDGRHRYKAVWQLGIEPKVETFHGTEAEKIALVMSENVHRRHLTLDQRKAIAADLAEKLAEAARARMVAGTLAPTDAKGKATEQAAKMVGGVSSRSVERALHRKRTDPEAHEKAKAGTLGRDTSYRDALQAIEPNVGAYMVKDIKRGHIAVTTEQVKAIAELPAEEQKAAIIQAHQEHEIGEDRAPPSPPSPPVSGRAAPKGPKRYAQDWVDVEWLQTAPIGAVAEWMLNVLGRDRLDDLLDALTAPDEAKEDLGDEYAGEMPETQPNGAEPPRTKTYTCMVDGCGTFEGPIQRGQPPKFCPEHRTAAARRKAKAAAL
jgi:ParB-like chromosome segregation protein Spo0J